MNLLGQTAPATIIDWAQFGVTGFVILALMMGWLWAKPSVEQLLDSIRRLTAEVVALREEKAKLEAEHSICEDEMRQLKRDLDRLKPQ